jgi:hypothetical protein
VSEILATRATMAAIRLTVRDHGEAIAVTLEPKRALLLGAEGELTLEQAQLTLWGEIAVGTQAWPG